jgi:hypothetical protein
MSIKQVKILSVLSIFTLTFIAMPIPKANALVKTVELPTNA